MFGSKPLRHLSYPLCLALSWNTVALGDEPLVPLASPPTVVEFGVTAPQGTGVLKSPAPEAPLVPPLPTSIDAPIEPAVETSAGVAEAARGEGSGERGVAASVEPDQIVAEGKLLTPPAAVSAEVVPALTRPLKTNIADPLADLNAQQETIRQQQQVLEAEEIQLAPSSELAPGTSRLRPIEDSELPTVNPSTIEVVKQRYPDGTVKLAYEVGRDDQDNYVKHGDWKLFNVAGDVIAQGEYRDNQRHGAWRRWHSGAESAMFLQAPYTQFTPPFYSEAEFKHDELDGTWTITDSKHRTISELHFRDGLRHGKATWWHANGNLMQEIDFVDGELHGELNVWSSEGQQVANHIYEHGRRDAPKLTKFPNGQKKAEGSILEARTYITEPDDWWNAKTAVFTKEGMDEKHGLWRQWHPNGTLHVEGTYEHHVEHGKFTWWYATGQKALVGHYHNGQRDGQWCWWHTNGQKQSEGMFSADEAIATWIWWNEDGSVARRTEAGQDDPTSRTAEGKNGPIKSTSFEGTPTEQAAPRMLPVPDDVR